MSTKIIVLPDFVIDQIAAGEVLENAASAVKELVENSLDAGAKEIRIEIEGGGLQRILIEDDGCGMSSIDAQLCLKRHATSKIRSAEELERLSTMGFRGEALAALASVSKLELRTSDGNESTKVVASGGEISSCGRCARNRGTSIEARDLFFNAPARLKFQKSAAASAAAILKAVETLSLSNCHVRFSLYSNGKLTFEAKPKKWQERAEELFGPLGHSVDFSEAGISLKGLLSRPEEGKATRSGQTLFVNRRPIVSPLIAKAVKQGYGTRMVESLFPSFVLFLDIPPDLVDVNVHPQKREVRFREESRLFTAICKAISSIFESQAPDIAPLPWEFTREIPTQYLMHSEEPSFLQLAETAAPAPVFSFKIPARPLAILGPYLLIEDERWMLVDLPGVEARILFEAIKKEKPESEALLWPLEMEVEEPEEAADLLRPLGIEARVLGKRGLSIDSMPVGMRESDLVDFIRHYISDRALAANITRVCRARNKKFGLEEGAMLWEKLKDCSDSIYDPLGKKVVSEISKEELAKRFA